ncbi:MAG: hypothetical protein ACLTXM_01305, partial [Enterococcus sp.]
SSFASGRWYPANGKTILHSSPDRTEDKLDFGVPSVRAFNEDFVIPVKKSGRMMKIIAGRSDKR